MEEMVLGGWQEGEEVPALHAEYIIEQEVLQEVHVQEVAFEETEKEFDGSDKAVAAYYDVTETSAAAEEASSVGDLSTVRESFKCPYCEKTFELRNSLSNHVKSHSNLRLFECQICGSRFKKEGDYLRHMSLCGKDHQFKCNKCGKSFMNMNSLTNHIRVHISEKPFSCPHCSASFKKQGDMKNHEVRFCK